MEIEVYKKLFEIRAVSVMSQKLPNLFRGIFKLPTP